MPSCSECGGTVIEYDSAAGNGFCVLCGTVVEENTIVSEVTFGETASGGAMVQGSFVGQGATHARMAGPYGNRGSGESREQTIANASRKIQSIANVLRLSEAVCLAATRLYTLAVEHKFTKGRKSMNVVAVCLYVACRQKETRNYMLIDFSDLLQVNVFEIGHTYLQLVQTLNLRLPLVDPSHYISRFAALLEFGEETSKVATDAVRLVQRFDRDWMTRGRRPAGICGAALLLAARMNNFRRSVEEIVQVVKIADTTLKQRLEEFKASPSGQLTLADFRSVWLEEECDPPAFVKARESEKQAEEGDERPAEADEGWSSEKERQMKESVVKSRKGKKRKGKRKREASDDGEVERTEGQAEKSSANTVGDTGSGSIEIDPVLLKNAAPLEPDTLARTASPPDITPDPVVDDGTDKDDDVPGDVLSPTKALHSDPPSESVDPGAPSHDTAGNLPLLRPMDPVEETVATALAEEVTTFLQNSQGTKLTDVLDEAEQRRLAQIKETVVDELTGLDEEELDWFLLNEEEVKLKERVWVEMNRDYLEALAAKGIQAETGQTTKSRKRRKSTTKPRDASTPHGTSTADSVRKMLKKNPKYSKRINYDALKDLFVDGVDIGAFANMDDKTDKDDDIPIEGDKEDALEGLYPMDDKSEGGGEGGMVIIEENNEVAPPKSHDHADTEADADADADIDAEGDLDTGWGDGAVDDGYEQEV